MSASTIAGAYTIEGCRNGLAVSKIVKLTAGNCEKVTFSDGGTSLLPAVWTEGACSVSSAISSPGGIDFTTVANNTLALFIGIAVVKSITLLAKTNCDMIISGNPKTLSAGFAYTWSHGDGSNIDVSMFTFVNGGVEVEAIRENI